MSIDVKPAQGDEFAVIVEDDSGKASFLVTLDDTYHNDLTGGKEDKESLIRRSFEFLLVRESKGSILSSFDLRVISRYFPEYERHIRA